MCVADKIKQLRKQFDDQTQAVRGALIVDLEELEQWVNERRKAVGNEKLKQKWAHIVACIASEYDASKIDARLDELERLFREAETIRYKATKYTESEESTRLFINLNQI